jgi:hypothetical protein
MRDDDIVAGDFNEIRYYKVMTTFLRPDVCSRVPSIIFEVHWATPGVCNS